MVHGTTLVNRISVHILCDQDKMASSLRVIAAMTRGFRFSVGVGKTKSENRSEIHTPGACSSSAAKAKRKHAAPKLSVCTQRDYLTVLANQIS